MIARTLRTLITLAFALTALTASAQTPLPLTQTLELSDLGYAFDFPEGWASVGDTIAPTEDAARRYLDSVFLSPKETLAIGMDDQPLAFFRDGGLPENATLDDLLTFNLRALGLEQLTPVEEVEVFGVPALSALVTSPRTGMVAVAVQGFIDLDSRSPSERGFLITVEAPTRAEIDAFLTTWEAMLASQRPLD